MKCLREGRRGDIRRRMPRRILRDECVNECLRFAQTFALESDPPDH